MKMNKKPLKLSKVDTKILIELIRLKKASISVNVPDLARMLGLYNPQTYKSVDKLIAANYVTYVGGITHNCKNQTSHSQSAYIELTPLAYMKFVDKQEEGENI